MGRWPGQARGAHLASRMIKLFVGPVCRGRPGCHFLVGAEHVRAPTPPRPRWPRGLARRLPRGLRASCSRHLQGGSCQVSRVLWLLIFLSSLGDTPTPLGAPGPAPWGRAWRVQCPALRCGTGPGAPTGLSCTPSRALLVCLTFQSTVLGMCDFILRPY